MSISFKLKTSRKFQLLKQQLLLITLLIAIVLLITVSANQYRTNIDYKPYNGAFQSFNISRRIFEGEFPGRDFNPYLGLGPTYLNAFTTYVFGSDFAASQFSSHFVSPVLHLLALITLFFLSGFTIRKSITSASIVIVVLLLDVKRITPFWELAGPGNSNLSIRSALPFLTSLVVFLVFRLYRYPIVFYCLVGCLIGIQPLWSNDYGIPSCLTLSGVIILDLIKQQKANKLSKVIILFFFAFVTFFIASCTLTLGHPTNWIRDNFSGVAADQFWYYVWYNGKNKIFSVSDIFSHPFFYLYITAIILVLLYVLIKDYSVKYILLLHISITVFGAGILSSIGGTISSHYYLPSIFVSLFIIPLATHFTFTRFCPNKLTRSYKQILSTIKSKFFVKIRYFLPTAFLVIYTTALAVNTSAYHLFEPILSNNNGIFVAELGGWLPSKWEPAIQIARNINIELKNESSTQKVLSTYSSAMDVIAGATNPTGIDYIIHALGDRARTQYLQKFKDSKPKYITTLREDFSAWETWLRRTNWWFYREFVHNYQPVEATFYNIIWKRLDNPINISYPQAMCRIIQESDNKVTVNISTKAEDNNIYYVDTTLKYHLKVEHSGIPIIGGRGLVNATEKETALTRFIGKELNRSYGMPPSHNNWHIPIEHRMGTVSVLEIKGYPENRSKLTVESCQAQLFAPIDSFAVTRRLTATNLSNAHWKNGISVISQKNPDSSHVGLIITDSKALPKIYPGMDVEFSRSGKRRIIEIKDDQILVTGTELDPLADGYPNPIIMKLR